MSHSSTTYVHLRKRSDQVFRALFHADDEIAIGAAIFLGRIQEKNALRYLLQALLTKSSKRASAIMWSLGEIGDQSAVEILQAAIKNNFAIKSALVALGKIGAPQAMPAIGLMLNHNDETVRALSVKAFGKIKWPKNSGLDEQALEILNDRLKKETSRKVKLLISVVCSNLLKNNN